jgi:hypothetical protein
MLCTRFNTNAAPVRYSRSNCPKDSLHAEHRLFRMKVSSSQRKESKLPKAAATLSSKGIPSEPVGRYFFVEYDAPSFKVKPRFRPWFRASATPNLRAC